MAAKVEQTHAARQEAMRAIQDAIGVYLQTCGWEVAVIDGSVRIGQPEHYREDNHDFIVLFTGRHLP